jgi:hypothetical protein
LSTIDFDRWEALRDSAVLKDVVTLKHRRRRVQLEIYRVVGDQAVILAGPTQWLPLGKHWFCFSNKELCGLLASQMDKFWGPEHISSTEFAESLDKMVKNISRVDEMTRTLLTKAHK